MVTAHTAQFGDIAQQRQHLEQHPGQLRILRHVGKRLLPIADGLYIAGEKASDIAAFQIDQIIELQLLRRNVAQTGTVLAQAGAAHTFSIRIQKTDIRCIDHFSHTYLFHPGLSVPRV